jgi:septal ring factor EnvC (AmiA/AmiB activator)
MDNSHYRKLDAAQDARESEAFDCAALRTRLAEVERERDALDAEVDRQRERAKRAERAVEDVTAERDEKHRALTQIASSLSEFERVEAVGMKSASMPDKIDALLLDLARLRRFDRERPAVITERDEARETARTLASDSRMNRRPEDRAAAARRALAYPRRGGK